MPLPRPEVITGSELTHYFRVTTGDQPGARRGSPASLLYDWENWSSEQVGPAQVTLHAGDGGPGLLVATMVDPAPSPTLTLSKDDGLTDLEARGTLRDGPEGQPEEGPVVRPSEPESGPWTLGATPLCPDPQGSKCY